mgnify:CR=1 FL=1
MNQHEDGLTDTESLELLAFLITSANGCASGDPVNYGTYRLITAAAQLARAWRPKCSGETAAFLDDLLARMVRDVDNFEANLPAYQAFLAESSRVLALEIRRRGHEDEANDGT